VTDAIKHPFTEQCNENRRLRTINQVELTNSVISPVTAGVAHMTPDIAFDILPCRQCGLRMGKVHVPRTRLNPYHIKEVSSLLMQNVLSAVAEENQKKIER
jgi:hypothetical protein